MMPLALGLREDRGAAPRKPGARHAADEPRGRAA